MTTSFILKILQTLLFCLYSHAWFGPIYLLSLNFLHAFQHPFPMLHTLAVLDFFLTEFYNLKM